MRRSLLALLASLLALSAGAHDRLGANLNLLADFTRNHEFVDVMRQAREFGSFADPFNTVIPVGPDGWPTGDFGVTLMAAQSGVAGLAGTYRVIFNGRATVTSAASGTVGTPAYNEAANETRVDFTFPADGDTMALRFAVTPGAASNAVKNLRVIRPGFDPANHPTFTPAWLAHVSRFRILRFMDWLSTNHRANTVVAWADRPTLEKKRTDAEGARWETIVELSNTVRRDPWINIPVRANDDYVRNLATQLRDTLDPALHVYVEYSNELWNGTFEQFAIQRSLAVAEAASPSSPLRLDGVTDPSIWAFRRVGKRSKEIADIFASVFGQAAMNNRVRVVLPGQMGNSFVVSEALDVVDRGMNTRPASVFYAISGAPYIFPSGSNDSEADEAPGFGVEQILEGMAAGIANAPRSYEYEEHAGLAAWHGLRVLAYEGGFDTFGGANIAAKRAANLDPRVRAHCRRLIDDWHAAGFDEFLWFNAGAATYDTPFGAWPLLEDLADPAKPKNQCMDDTLAAALPATTIGFATGTTIPAGAYQGATSTSEPLTNASSAFGFPGYAQYLIRAPQAGTYELRFRAMGSSVPLVGVQLNGALVSAAHALPDSGAFADSQPRTVTLRQGVNALRLVRPASAGQWTIQSLTVGAGGSVAATNYTSMWWNSAESGWGVNVNHQADTLFATLFTYAPEGRDLWLVGSSLARQADGSYTGALHRATGPAFNASPWPGISLAEAGSMTFRFASADRGTLTYTFQGITVQKSIERYVFAPPPTCTTTTGSRASETNYQDMWWNTAESGWGINLTHQGNTIFATLFTYAPDGRDLWLVASSLARQSDGRFTGAVHRTTGPAFNALPWSAISLAEVGTMTLAFTDGERGTLTYTFNGTPVSKSITRYVFAAGVPVCR
jgi:hypothetical protein